MARENTIAFELKQGLYSADDLSPNRRTRNSYEANCNKFASYLKEQGVKKESQLIQKYGTWDRAIQSWADHLVADKKSSYTVNTYIAAVCKARHLSKEIPRLDKEGNPIRNKYGRPVYDKRFNLPARSVADVKKGRNGGSERAKKEATNPHNTRIVNFARAVDIRREEYADLKGKDLVKDESGYLCVQVDHGKGGKYQLQRILPEYEQVVKDTFAGVKAKEKLFHRSDMKKDLNLHQYRRETSMKAYEYYRDRLHTEAGYREKLIKELQDRWSICHKCGNNDKDFPSKTAFARELARTSNYECRGKNREAMIMLGLPVSYERLPLLAVSVFHLSHWRNDVTVEHYFK